MTANKHYCSLYGSRSFSRLPKVPPGDHYWLRFKRMLRKAILVSETNLFTSYYLRSHAALLDERKLHVKSKYWYIIHPFSRFRNFWNKCMFVVTFYNLFVSPFYRAFLQEKSIFMNSTNMLIIVTTIDVVLTLDLIVKLCTAYYEYETKIIVLQPRKIFMKYLKGTLIPDLLVATPVDYLYLQIVPDYRSSESMSVIYLLCALEVFVLFRSKRFLKTLNYIMLQFTSWGHGTRALIKLFAIFLITSHWLACMYFYVPTVTTILIGSGRGMVEYERSEEIFMASFTMLLGAFFVNYCLAICLRLLSVTYLAEYQYDDLLSQLESYTFSRNLPKHLGNRLIQYYVSRFHKHFFKEDKILKGLPRGLFFDLRRYTTRCLIMRCPLFRNILPGDISQFVKALRYDIYLPNDVIVAVGSSNRDIFFIKYGTVYCLTAEGKEVFHLEDGEYFGEITSLLNFGCESGLLSYIASDIVEIYRLDRKSVKNLILPNNQLLKRMEIHTLIWLTTVIANDQAVTAKFLRVLNAYESNSRSSSF